MTESIQTSKKKRNGAPKSRRGCLTCKTRHKKCDELKPSCTPCTSTGRTCDFLHPATTPTHIPPSRPRRTTTVPIRSSKLPPLIPAPTYGTPIPAHTLPHFSYFTHLITNSTYSPFNTGTFQSLILQLSHQEPCILNAILAIASLLKHQSKTHHPAINVNSYRIDSHVFFAKALEGLKKRLGDKEEEGKWEVAIAGSVLFATFELLGGSDQSAGRNLVAGTEMLRMRLKSSRPSQTILSLSQAFTHFNLQITTLDTFWSDRNSPLPVLPPSFASLFTARHSLDDITAYIAAIFKPVKPPTQTLPYFPLSHCLNKSFVFVQELLEQWERKFNNLVKARQGEKIGGFDTGVKILRMSFLVANTNLQTLFYGDEIAFDAYIPSFRSIVELAESVLFPTLSNGRERNRSEGAPTFTFEASLIPPLYFTGIKCRDTRIRRKARELLGYCGVEGIWIGEATAAIVGWVHGVESGKFSTPNSSFIRGSPDHYFGSLSTPSTSGTGSTLGSFTPVSTPSSGSHYSEFDFGSSTRILVDSNTSLNEDVFISSASRLRNLKIAISKATSCAYVVSRRKIFFSFVDPLLQGGFQWEYISGIVRWDVENGGRELGKEGIEDGDKIIRDMVCVYREAMERLDLGMEGKDDDGGGLEI